MGGDEGGLPISHLPIRQSTTKKLAPTLLAIVLPLTYSSHDLFVCHLQSCSCSFCRSSSSLMASLNPITMADTWQGFQLMVGQEKLVVVLGGGG